MDWKAITDEILSRLDIRQEYEALGLRVRGAPRESGWLTAFAIDRDERMPSAAIKTSGEHVGRYKDSGGEGLSLSLFDFAARFMPARFSSWQAARDFYASRAGVKIKKERGSYKNVRFVPWSDSIVSIFTRKKPPITVDGIRLLGGKLAVWPVGAPSSSNVLAFPCHETPGRTCGQVLTAVNGGMLLIYQGEGRPPLSAKVAFAKPSRSGLVGDHALAHLATAELVWKVEGISDALSLQSIIPTDLLDKHLVLTNAGGATEIPHRDWGPIFQGRHVVVVGDCDKPGQAGAERWVAFLSPLAASVKNLVLPYKIEENHGEDLRNFIASGKSYEAVLDLPRRTVVAHEPILNGQDRGDHKQAEGLSRGERLRSSGSPDAGNILNALGLDVLGSYRDNSIEVFSIQHRKLFAIKAISRFGFADLLQCAGEDVHSHVSDSREPIPGRLRMSDVRNAIAAEAGKTPLTARTPLGAGCWRIEGTDDIVVVDAGSAALWDGKTLAPVERPRVGDQVLDFSSSSSWCDLDSLRAHLLTVNPPAVYKELKALFAKWKWRDSWSPTICAALSICTWVQTLWTYRPLIALTGETHAGKSTLFDTLLCGLYGALAFHAQQPTEAGLRQHVRNNACVVIIDELEHSQHRGKVMELLRTSSRGGRVFRGTPSQHGLAFGLKHIVWMAAIESGLKKGADWNRFIQLEIKKKSRAEHGKISLPSSAELGDLGLRALAVALRCVDRAIAIAGELKSTAVPGIHGRIVESFAVPIAMIAAIYGHSVEQAASNLDAVLADVSTEGLLSDEEDLVLAILSSQVTVGVGGKTITVAEVITDKQARVDYRETLERAGVALVSDTQGPRTNQFSHVFLSPTTIQRYLLRGTRWFETGIDVRQILRRIPGAVSVQKALAGTRASGVQIPVDYFVSAMEVEEPKLELGGEE